MCILHLYVYTYLYIYTHNMIIYVYIHIYIRCSRNLERGFCFNHNPMEAICRKPMRHVLGNERERLFGGGDNRVDSTNPSNLTIITSWDLGSNRPAWFWSQSSVPWPPPRSDRRQMASRCTRRVTCRNSPGGSDMALCGSDRRQFFDLPKVATRGFSGVGKFMNGLKLQTQISKVTICKTRHWYVPLTSLQHVPSATLSM